MSYMLSVDDIVFGMRDLWSRWTCAFGLVEVRGWEGGILEVAAPRDWRPPTYEEVPHRYHDERHIIMSSTMKPPSTTARYKQHVRERIFDL